MQTFQIKTDYNNYTDQIIKTDILKILIPEKNDFYSIKLNCQQVKEANHTEKYKTKTTKKSLTENITHSVLPAEMIGNQHQPGTGHSKTL